MGKLCGESYNLKAGTKVGQLQKLSPGCLGLTVYQEVRGLKEGNVLETKCIVSERGGQSQEGGGAQETPSSDLSGRVV